jgi:hypothetical protein
VGATVEMMKSGPLLVVKALATQALVELPTLVRACQW